MHFERAKVQPTPILAHTPPRHAVAFVVAIYDTGVGVGAGGSLAYVEPVELYCALSYGFRRSLRRTTCCDFLSLPMHYSPVYVCSYVPTYYIWVYISLGSNICNERTSGN